VLQPFVRSKTLPACASSAFRALIISLHISKITMANKQSFRWRTVAEVGVISAVIYFFLGTPGFPTSLISISSTQDNVPVSRAKIESLVYPPKDLQCPDRQYDVHVFSTTPLIVYIDGFLSDAEAEHLVASRYVVFEVLESTMDLRLTIFHVAKTDGKSRPSSTKALKQPMPPSANPRRRS